MATPMPRETAVLGVDLALHCNMFAMRHGSEVATRTSARFETRSPHTVPILCLAVLTAVWVALAIAPRHRMDWFLESLTTLILVPTLVLTYSRRRFSDRAYIQGTVLLVLHTIGSHYTYSEVPLGDWLREAFGWDRNHYDRIVHFSFGLLGYRGMFELAYGLPTRETRAFAHYLTLGQVAFWSLLYEVVEWIVAILVDPAAGTAFLGTQGDPWDCEKDMALALAGGVIAATGLAMSARRKGLPAGE
jgi:putative membrane protein